MTDNNEAEQQEEQRYLEYEAQHHERCGQHAADCCGPAEQGSSQQQADAQQEQDQRRRHEGREVIQE